MFARQAARLAVAAVHLLPAGRLGGTRALGTHRAGRRPGAEAGVRRRLSRRGLDAGAWRLRRKFEHLFRGFRSNLYALVPLGIVFLAGIMLAVLATMLVDGGKLIGMLSRRGKADAKRRCSAGSCSSRCCSAACAHCRRCSRCGLRPRWWCSRTRAPRRRWRRVSARRSPTGARWRRMARWCSPSAALLPGLVLSIAQTARRDGRRHVWRCSWSCRTFSRSSRRCTYPTTSATAMCSTRMNRYSTEPRPGTVTPRSSRYLTPAAAWRTPARAT